MNKTCHNSSLSLLGLVIIHPCHHSLVGFPVHPETFSTHDIHWTLQAMYSTQMFRSTSRPNSPKPLVVPTHSQHFKSLSSSEIKEDELTFPFLVFVARQSICAEFPFLASPESIYHKNFQITAEKLTLCCFGTYHTAWYVGIVAHWYLPRISQETLARSGPHYQNSAISPEFLQSISQGRFPPLQDNFPEAILQPTHFEN